MTAMSTTKKSIVFLVLAFAISWAIVGAGAAMGAATTPQIAILTMIAMMYGPSIAAVICAFAFEKGRRRDALGLRFGVNWWWLVAWGIALVIAFGSTLVTVLAGKAEFIDLGANYIAQARIAMPEQTAALDQAAGMPGLSWIILAQATILGALINTPLLVISEELGWRGYLYDLWRRFGFWRTTLATGFFWGLWHAPAIYLFGLNYPDNRLIGIPLFIAFCMLFSAPFTLVRDRGKSVVAAAILHGTSNAVGGVAALCMSQIVFPWNGVVGIGGFAMLTLVALGSWLIAGARTPLPSSAAPAKHA
ncbi:MAG: CPBP family intramembrane glutamic endopeptidase [Terricaulis sp.]